jgi:hypothetical protein
VENVYYTILDHCYLAKYLNLGSKDIDTVISNVETLLTEMKAWRDSNIEFIIREKNEGKPQSFIFYTHDRKLADRVFKSACYKAAAKDFQKSILNDSNENNALENERIKMNETLNHIFKAIVSRSFEEGRLVTEPEEDLPETLFDDLEKIGLSTTEREAMPEDEIEPLPADLFDDLTDTGIAAVDIKTVSEDEENR